MKSREIRSAFTSFFEGQAHTHVPSGPLVPPNDPTLMFANAGMVQFKDVFVGKDKREYTRATTSQKCIRISGKHNDLENVGRTARHHTFFEMLGNFSFGDYFKREAIEFAWRFYMDVLKLDPERMVFTIFEGEEGYGPADEESAKLWAEITGAPPERIQRCNAKENFWQMGDTGPCGPCTEIHYFLGDDKVDPRTFGQEPTPDGRGWFELWNLVFMQFERKPGGEMIDLPAPSVDTGAGLERAAVVLQEVLSNYDTDLLRPIVDLASTISEKKYGGTQEEDDVSMRVIADHARLTAFAISEGINPGKGGRDYVLRRVMRRAIRHGYRLGIETPFLHDCALKVVDLMGDVYPQLSEQRALIEDVTRREEEQFRRTLKAGIDLIGSNKDWTDTKGTKTLPGPVAFKLYDTFGFPIDLQNVIGEERGFLVDQVGFDREMEAARERSRSIGTLNDAQASEKVYYDLRETVDGAVRFLGYDEESGRSTVAAIVASGDRVEEVQGEDVFEIVVPETPFYAEKGGQVGDRGVIRGPSGVFSVEDTQTPVDGMVVHRGRLTEGSLKVGDEVALEVDHGLRSATRRNHSATHLLHWALREILGPTVVQKGSLVGPDRLRFDYATQRAPSEDELARVEDMVNDAVLANTPITTDVLPMDEAKARGAIGIFEEKYGDVVRVLTIGPSLELCGGTHAGRTGDIGLFTVLSDGNVAAGVRRIEASTVLNALGYLRDTRNTLRRAAAVLKAAPHETPERITKVLAQQKERDKEIERLQRELVSGGGGADLSAEAREVDGVKVLGVTVPSVDANVLREMADQLKDKLSPAVVLLGTSSQDGKKALLVCTVSKEITKKFRAGDIVKAAAKVVGGGGGGRPDFAQAGGSDPSKLGDAVAQVYEVTGA
ncbi:MAG: alanine--tRNA ligase [Myxococcota bacterium]